ncbi:DUF4394 domain-containing protein [Methyloversatilis thermotolerans]|uniref:DUF4394 domain-containing protein n=1 Tax=Methyloversatilis thermotolerans TaxID=1346290 RepID=UPI000361C0E3|nr:DUF4394 domain-containing protein [Methyloversatilis thermotolerans]
MSLPTDRTVRTRALPCVAATALLALSGCGVLPEAQGPLRKHTVRVVTDSHHLLTFNAGQPGNILSEVPLRGLADGEVILGIDYRVFKGDLYALGSSGRIYLVDVQTGQLQPVGQDRFAMPLRGRRFGFDFNPSADRIRIVSDSAQNLRAHPDSGALVDYDPRIDGLQVDGSLHYADGDPNAGRASQVIAAAYTYNKENEKITTNFAIDLGTGALVRQGSVEGETPVVSPNLGKLYTVGPLGLSDLLDAHFDIADLDNAALATFVSNTDRRPQLYDIDLTTGKASRIGHIGKGEGIRGMAIEP